MIKKILIAALFLQAGALHCAEQITKQDQALMQLGALEQCLQAELSEIPNDLIETSSPFEQFKTTLASFLAEHGAIVKKSGGIGNWYQTKLYIGSYDDISQPITPNVYPALVEICKQADHIPAWHHTMTIPVLVEENGSSTMQQLKLTDIINGLTLVPLSANYYATAVNFLKTAAAVTLIGVGGYLAYKALYTTDEEINSINPAFVSTHTAEQENTDESLETTTETQNVPAEVTTNAQNGVTKSDDHDAEQEGKTFSDVAISTELLEEPEDQTFFDQATTWVQENPGKVFTALATGATLATPSGRAMAAKGIQNIQNGGAKIIKKLKTNEQPIKPEVQERLDTIAQYCTPESYAAGQKLIKHHLSSEQQAQLDRLAEQFNDKHPRIKNLFEKKIEQLKSINATKERLEQLYKAKKNAATKINMAYVHELDRLFGHKLSEEELIQVSASKMPSYVKERIQRFVIENQGK